MTSASPRRDRSVGRPLAAAAERDDREAERAAVDARDEAGLRQVDRALHRRAAADARRPLQKVGGAAERRDHAREALGRSAAVQRALGAPPRIGRLGGEPAISSSSAASARVTSCSRGSARAPVSRPIASCTSSALPAVRPRHWSMSVSSAATAQPGAVRDLDQRCGRDRARPRAKAGRRPSRP